VRTTPLASSRARSPSQTAASARNGSAAARFTLALMVPPWACTSPSSCTWARALNDTFAPGSARMRAPSPSVTVPAVLSSVAGALNARLTARRSSGGRTSFCSTCTSGAPVEAVPASGASAWVVSRGCNTVPATMSTERSPRTV